MLDWIDPRKILPTLLIVIDIGAALVYLYHDGTGGWRAVGYWTSAAVLTYCVTY